MTELDEWVERVREALELGPADVRLVLDVARDVAHGVLRPAAPVSAYLLGVAVGRGADPAQAAATISDLARDWAGAGGYPGPAAAPGKPAGDSAGDSAIPASPEPPD